jgi:hypothetical protein
MFENAYIIGIYSFLSITIVLKNNRNIFFNINMKQQRPTFNKSIYSTRFHKNNLYITPCYGTNIVTP